MAIKEIHIRVNDKKPLHKNGWEKILQYRNQYGGTYADAVFGLLNNTNIIIEKTELQKEEIEITNKPDSTPVQSLPKVKEVTVSQVSKPETIVTKTEPEIVKEEKKITQEEYDKMSQKEKLRAIVKKQYAP